MVAVAGCEEGVALGDGVMLVSGRRWETPPPLGHAGAEPSSDPCRSPGLGPSPFRLCSCSPESPLCSRSAPPGLGVGGLGRCGRVAGGVAGQRAAEVPEWKRPLPGPGGAGPRGKGPHRHPRARLPGPGVGEGAGHTPEGRCKSSTPECVRKEATGLAHTHAHPHPSITPRRAQGGKGGRCGSQTGSLLWCSHP